MTSGPLWVYGEDVVLWRLTAPKPPQRFAAPSHFSPGLPLGCAVRTVSCIKQEDQEFKASICHIVNLRLAWAT